MNIGNIVGATEKMLVTDTPGSMEVVGPDESRRTFYIVADVAMHLSFDGDAAPDTAMRVPADYPIKVSAFAGQTLSVVKADGAADGAAWVTLTD